MLYGFYSQFIKDGTASSARFSFYSHNGTHLPSWKEAQTSPHGETTRRGCVRAFETGAASNTWEGVPADNLQYPHDGVKTLPHGSSHEVTPTFTSSPLSPRAETSQPPCVLSRWLPAESVSHSVGGLFVCLLFFHTAIVTTWKINSGS